MIDKNKSYVSIEMFSYFPRLETLTMLSRKSFAKVNIFLKITGKKSNYHEILSRFIRVEDLYDEITFQYSNRALRSGLEVEGKFTCSKEKNSIVTMFNTLQENDLNLKYKDTLLHFFKHHKVVVQKRIPEFGGLGGGPSNAATFLLMVNDICRLGFTPEELSILGAKVGADVSFFIREVISANVMGIGDIVEVFNERPLELELKTPAIRCNTTDVYQHFRRNRYKEITEDEINWFSELKSREVFEVLNASQANDLYESTMSLYPDLTHHANKGWFMSGSGSTMFRLKRSAEDAS